jgi:hypothetical protein
MAEQTPYGCKDKQIMNGYYVMQRHYHAFGQYSMEPTYIRHTMTTECQWSKTHVSDRCDGCNRKQLQEDGYE